MISSKLIDVHSIYLFLCNQQARYSYLLILTFSFVFSYYISVLSGILLAFAFPLGAVAFNIICTTKVIESLPLFEGTGSYSDYKLGTNAGCNVCGDSHCKRQKAFKDNQPWLGLNVPKDVDQAVQDLFNKILNEFITSWHSNFTKDESFVVELRRCLRYASSILLKRLLHVDIAEIITDQLLTIGLRHVNDFMHISQLSLRERISIEAASVKYLNKRLHVAVRSRKSELQYLRYLSELLSNHLVQGPQLKCLSFKVLIRELLAGWVFLPLTDALCDPFCINSLILLGLNYDPTTEFPDNSGIQVQFLHKFVIQNKDLNKKFVLQSNLSAILKDQKLLYAFMQFLKKEGALHFLQFCLHVEEFGKKILNPDLSKSEMENLYKEAWDVFSVYFKTDSPDCIHFPTHIVQQMEQILDYGASNINKLLTNPVLFKAYEVAYSKLEDNYCSLFYLSDEYFLLLCGERQTAKSPKANFSSPVQPASPVRGRLAGRKAGDGSVVGKLSSKFNKLLQFQAVEGRAYFNDVGLDLSEGECAEDLEVDSSQENVHRDMSTWLVSVPYVTTKQDSNSKPYPVFNINVRNISTKENSNQKSKWNVERRFNDFYILQAKLTEFHGEFEDGTQLPPKTGMFSPRGSEFLENRRQLFEEYLQKLLQKPSLRGSDLLYFFLHGPVEFSSCLSAQDGFGKMIRRSVEPIKLRKEKGQRLENFLNVFLSSTEGSKKSGKYEWQDVNVERPRKRRDVTKSIFRNNFAEFESKIEENCSTQKEALVLVGPWDCVLYAMSELMGASSRLIQAAITIKNLLGQSSDFAIRKIVRNKLDLIFVSAKISHLIRLLQDALFNSTYQPGKQGYKILKERIISEMKGKTDSFLIRWLLPDFNEGIDAIIETLQFPILNKHLCYCLLDEIVRILFPELGTSC